MHRILKAQMNDLESMNAFLTASKSSSGFVQVHAFGRVKVHLDVLILEDGIPLKKTITVSRNELAKHALYLAKHELNPGVKMQLKKFRGILANIDREANSKLRHGNRMVSAGRKIATIGHFLYDRNKKLNQKISSLPKEKLVEKPKKEKAKRKFKESLSTEESSKMPPKKEKDSDCKGYRRESDVTIDLDESSET